MRPKICAVITDNNLAMVRQAEEFADLLEVRIDLIGKSWQELAKQLNKPWIACNRIVCEGGQWYGSEDERIDELLKAINLGADIIDIELNTTDLVEVVSVIKEKAQCLVSFHDLIYTPPIGNMIEIVKQEIAAGADICKLVTTAQRFDDDIRVLQLISWFPERKVISFAGLTSRILCPLVGGNHTYASIMGSRKVVSEITQLTVRELRKMYEIIAIHRTTIGGH